MSSSDPSKTNAQWNSTVGNIKESTGNIFGSKDLSDTGKKQHEEGEVERREAEAKQYGEGLVDSAKGKVQNVGGAISGDKNEQAKGNVREESGKAKREFA